MEKEELRKIIGQNIRDFRCASGINILELADTLNLSSGFLGLMERGERGTTALILYKLSELFSEPIDSFFRHNKEIQYEGEFNKLQKRIQCLTYDFTASELTLLTYVIYGIRDMKVGNLQKEQFRKEYSHFV